MNNGVSPKSIRVAPISSRDANALVARVHYSGRIVNNSQAHFGVFLNGRLEGAMQFGPSMDKRKMLGLVSGTAWNGFLELNRMAFSAALPRNSESRAIGVALRMIRAHYPHIEWVVSFADATQCGDGTIYRASGFSLTGIRENRTLYEFPTGDRVAAMTIEANWDQPITAEICRKMGIPHKYRTRHEWVKLGARALPGFQLRYIYFLNAGARDRLTVPILPFSRIDELGARMYLGEARVKQAITGDQSAERQGSTDPHAPKTP